MQTSLILRIAMIVTLSITGLSACMAGGGTPPAAHTNEVNPRDGTPTPIRRANELVQKTKPTGSVDPVSMILRWQVAEWDGKNHTVKFHIYFKEKSFFQREGSFKIADDSFVDLLEYETKGKKYFDIKVTTNPKGGSAIPPGLYLIVGSYDDQVDSFTDKGARSLLFHVDSEQP